MWHASTYYYYYASQRAMIKKSGVSHGFIQFTHCDKIQTEEKMLPKLPVPYYALARN